MDRTTYVHCVSDLLCWVCFGYCSLFWCADSTVSFGTRIHGVTSQKTAIFVNFVDSGGGGVNLLFCYSKVIFVNFVDSWGEVNLLFQGYFREFC